MRSNLSALAVVAALSAAVASAVHAQPADPAAVPVAQLNDALIAAMKQGGSGAYRARYNALKPMVEQALDLPAMTRLSVGAAWTNLSEGQRAALIAAFERLTVASYAHNFNGYNGERFTMDPHVDARKDGDKIVQTHLLPRKGEPLASLAYRLRQTSPGAAWKVIDVYYNGSISQLNTRRADFAGTLSMGGPQALISQLNSQADKLAK
jgi:phospholipid transport system substrate-binding protein